MTARGCKCLSCNLECWGRHSWKGKSRICSGSSVKQTCILKETESLVFRGGSSKWVSEKLCIFSFLFLTVQVLRGRIVCFEMEICSCVKPSQAVQITTLNAVANHMRVFFPPLLLTCEVVPWLLDQVESEMYWKSSLVSWLSCTGATCGSGHLMHAIMTEVSVEPGVLVLAELALYLLFSFTVYVVSFHSR